MAGSVRGVVGVVTAIVPDGPALVYGQELTGPRCDEVAQSAGLLYVLGVRTVYLLGCDFRMEPGRQNYAFEQDRSLASIRSNNASYRILNARLGRLKPYFDAEGFQIFNCTPHSGLTVFPTCEYAEAIHQAQTGIPKQINTRGMYDSPAAPMTPHAVPPPHVPTPRLPPPTLMESRPEPLTPPTGKPLISTDIPLTLLAYVEVEQWNPFQKLWRDCESRWEWFRQLPAIICHSLGSAESRLEPLRARPGETRLEAVPAPGTGPHHIPSKAFAYAVRHTTSPWLFCLTSAAAVRSEECGTGLDLTWFQRRPGSRYAYIAPRRTRRLTTPWGAALKCWTRSLPALAAKRDPTADVPILGSPLFLLRTDWLRAMAPLLAQAPPGIPSDAVLGYLAARRADPGLQVHFHKYGWNDRWTQQSKIPPVGIAHE
ncbi:MAG: hypothetical protein LC104_21615 [Bacteroidales bacterium]|nr:hypothetical protein [Bacteroidales bacterium]